jgi:hypothetical protein
MRDLAFWTNSLPGIPTKRSLWAETVSATVTGNTTNDLLSDIHRSMTKLSRSLATLGLEPLLENNNVGVIFRACCTKLWSTAVTEGCPPSFVDKWIKYLPSRPTELNIFSDEAVKHGCLLVEEAKKFETKILIPSALMNLEMLDDGITYSDFNHKDFDFVSELIAEAGHDETFDWAKKFMGEETGPTLAVCSLFKAQIVDKEGLRHAIKVLQAALTGSISESETYTIRWGPFQRNPELPLLDSDEDWGSEVTSQTPEAQLGKPIPPFAEPRKRLEGAFVSKLMNPDLAHPLVIANAAHSRCTIGLAVTVNKSLRSWFGDILIGKVKGLANALQVRQALRHEDLLATDLLQVKPFSQTLKDVTLTPLVNYNAVARNKLCTLARVTQSDEGVDVKGCKLEALAAIFSTTRNAKWSSCIQTMFELTDIEAISLINNIGALGQAPFEDFMAANLASSLWGEGAYDIPADWRSGKTEQDVKDFAKYVINAITMEEVENPASEGNAVDLTQPETSTSQDVLRTPRQIWVHDIRSFNEPRLPDRHAPRGRPSLRRARRHTHRSGRDFGEWRRQSSSPRFGRFRSARPTEACRFSRSLFSARANHESYLEHTNREQPAERPLAHTRTRLRELQSHRPIAGAPLPAMAQLNSSTGSSMDSSLNDSATTGYATGEPMMVDSAPSENHHRPLSTLNETAHTKLGVTKNRTAKRSRSTDSDESPLQGNSPESLASLRARTLPLRRHRQPRTRTLTEAGMIQSKGIIIVIICYETWQNKMNRWKQYLK